MSFIGHTSLLSVAFSRCRYPGSWASVCRFLQRIARRGEGGGNRQAVSRKTLLHPTLYSLYCRWYRPGRSAEFRECRERPCNVIYCGNVRVTYSAYVRLYACLHLYRSYIEIIRMRHVSVASFHFDKKRFADCNSDTSRLIIGIARLQKGCPNATVQISFSFVTG